METGTVHIMAESNGALTPAHTGTGGTGVVIPSGMNVGPCCFKVPTPFHPPRCHLNFLLLIPFTRYRNHGLQHNEKNPNFNLKTRVKPNKRKFATWAVPCPQRWLPTQEETAV